MLENICAINDNICFYHSVDCWDGPEGYPHITHGHTWTSKIKFLDVLKTIAEHAWIKTE